MTTATHRYRVPGISCDHCRLAIEQEVGPLPGVEAVAVDVGARTVVVTGGDPTAIEAAIEEAGYTVER